MTNTMDVKGSHIAQSDRGGVSVVVDGNGNVVTVSGKPKFVLQYPPPVEHFTDREKELAKLLNDLQPD